MPRSSVTTSNSRPRACGPSAMAWISAPRCGRLRAGRLGHHQEAFHPEREAHARHVRTAQRPHEAVVAAAAADRALRTEHARDDFKDGSSVVVEPAHDLRIYDVRDAGGIEKREQRGEMLAARVAKYRLERRRGFDERHVARILTIQHAQRIAFQPPLRILAQLGCVRAKMREQRFAIERAARVVADRVDVQRRVGDAVRTHRAPTQAEILRRPLRAPRSRNTRCRIGATAGNALFAGVRSERSARCSTNAAATRRSR